jgi:hypothetical protein
MEAAHSLEMSITIYYIIDGHVPEDILQSQRRGNVKPRNSIPLIFVFNKNTTTGVLLLLKIYVV